MSSHFLVDKSMQLEAAFGGFAAARARPFAEPGVAPRFAPDRGFRLLSLDLELDIDPDARSLRGVTRLEVAPLPCGLGEVAFDLDDLQILSVNGEDGRPLSWRHDGGRLSVQGVRPEGERVEVRTAGSPVRGLYFIGPTEAEPHRAPMAWTQHQDEDARFVFPCVDHPSVKCPVRLAITAPPGYVVVSNGRLVAREGDTWRWAQDEPIPAYLITVVVARLAVLEERWRDRPVRYLAPEGTSEAVLKRVFGRTPAMLEAFSARFGVDYPWARYDQVAVHEFIFGGMENVAATTLTDLVLTDDRAAIDNEHDDLISHELAHQWFGDLVTCQDWSQAWLNEGFATYAEHIWRMHHQGAEEADMLLFQMLEEYLKEDRTRYRRPIVDYRFREPIDLFDRHLYEKACLVLHTLSGVLGEEPFWAGVRRYLEQNAHGVVHTRDLQRALEEVTGRNLDRFFQQWIYGAGHPVVDVEIAHEEGLLSITARQRQEGEGVAEAFVFPLRVVVVDAQGSRELTLPVRERERAWAIPCAGLPDRVEIDPGLDVLADLRLKAPRALLIASLEQDRGVVARIRAARALAEDGSPAAMAALTRALSREPFWGVRGQIALALGRRGGEQARQALLAALQDPHPRARLSVVSALAELNHPEVEQALTRLGLEGDPSLQVEGEAARSLGKLRSPRAREVSSALLERPSWGEVLRARALEGLGAARDPEALPILLAWTGPERPTRARTAAAAALGRLADEVPAARPAAVARLLTLVKDAPFRVALAAVGALGSARDPSANAVLHDVHDGAADGRLKRAAYEALQAIAEGRDSADALQGLRRDLDALREENRTLRDRVARLEKAGEPSTGLSAR